MANVNRPNGFRPVRHLNGSMFNGQVNLYYIPSTDANAYAVGDLVTFVGTTSSTVSNLWPNQPIGVPIVTRATNAAAVVVLGAIVGFLADPTNLQNSGYRPASNGNGAYVWVSDAPDIIYEAQLCGASAAAIAPNVSAAAGTNYIGLNAQINTTNAAASNFGAGLSNMMVDASTAATTATLPLKVIRYSSRIDQDLSAAGVYPKVEVVINTPFFGYGVAGI